MKNYYIHVQGQEVSQDNFSLSELKTMANSGLLKIKNESYAEINYCGFIETEKTFLISLPYSTPYSDYEPQSLTSNTKLLAKNTIRSIIKYSKTSNTMSAEVSIKGKLASYIELLDDYINNGIVSRWNKEYSDSGTGAISWSKTLNKYSPKLQPNGSLFFDKFERKNRLKNSNDLFTQIHLWSIKKSQEYVKFIFDEYDFDFELEEEENFSADFVKNVISEQMPLLTNDREKRIAELIYYIVAEANDEEYGCIICKRFEYVWEDILRVICSHDSKLKSFMPSASWVDDDLTSKILGINSSKYSPPPDVLFKHENNFFVIDAKYYDFINKFGRPGLTDLWKQVFYCEALKEVFNDMDISFYNALFFPVQINDDTFLIKKFSDIIFSTEEKRLENFSHLGAYALNLGLCIKSYLKSESIHKEICNYMLSLNNQQVAAVRTPL